MGYVWPCILSLLCSSGQEVGHFGAGLQICVLFRLGKSQSYLDLVASIVGVLRTHPVSTWALDDL